MKNKRHKLIAILFIKYYSPLCLFWIFLTMLSAIIDNIFNCNIYDFISQFSPLLSFPIIVTVGMFFISLFFEMCLWNLILYIPLLIAGIYTQLYQFGISISYAAYIINFIIIIFCLASAKIYANEKRRKKLNNKKLKTFDKKD